MGFKRLFTFDIDSEGWLGTNNLKVDALYDAIDQELSFYTLGRSQRGDPTWAWTSTWQDFGLEPLKKVRLIKVSFDTEIKYNHLPATRIIELLLDYGTGPIQIYRDSYVKDEQHTTEFIIPDISTASTFTLTFQGSLESDAYTDAYLYMGIDNVEIETEYSGEVLVKNISFSSTFKVPMTSAYNFIANPYNDYGGLYGGFGNSVDVSNGVCVIGCPYADSGHSINGGYLYVYDLATGQLIHQVRPEDWNWDWCEDYYLGRSVAICGDVFASTSPGDGDRYYDSGKAYSYVLSTGDTRHEIFNPSAYDDAHMDMMGNTPRSLAINEKYYVVSAPYEDSWKAYLNGVAYVFNAMDVTLKHILVSPTPTSYGYFGHCVQITDKYVIVSELGTNKVHFFSVMTGDIVYTLENPNYNSTDPLDSFGYAMDATNDYFVVSAIDEDGLIPNVGVVYVYKMGTWELINVINNPVIDEANGFGYEISLDGVICGISAKHYSTSINLSVGIVYLYNVLSGEMVGQIESPRDMRNVCFGESIRLDYPYYIISELDTDQEEIGKDACKYVHYGYYLDYMEPIGANVNVPSIACGECKLLFPFIEGTNMFLKRFTNPNPYNDPYDCYAESIAAANGKCIVGAYKEDSTDAYENGIAYVYDMSTESLLYTIYNPDLTTDYARFGKSVAISNSYCAVSAPYANQNVTVFDLTTGSLVQTLTNPKAASTPSNYFGFHTNSIALTDTHCLVGAGYETVVDGEDTYTSTGKAYLYNVSTGALLFTFDNPNDANNAFFGKTVAINSNYCFISVPKADLSRGCVYVFDISTGLLVQTIDNPTGSFDRFGSAISVSGNTLVVTAPYADTTTNTESGILYVIDTTTWTVTRGIEYPNNNDNMQMGLEDVGLYGNYCIVSSQNEPTQVNENVGAAFIFDITTGNLIRTISNPRDYSGAEFGMRVEVEGNNFYISEKGPEREGILRTYGYLHYGTIV